MTSRELLDYLFAGSEHPLAPAMAAWLGSSRRFAAFVAQHRSKVRKKLRSSRPAPGLGAPRSPADDLTDALTDELADDLAAVRLELETAYLLLRERAFALEYEPRLASQRRSPDFAVSHAGQSPFMLEVTRVRALDVEPVRLAAAIAGVLGSKLGQLASGRSNVVLVGLSDPAPSPEALRWALNEMQGRAERGEGLERLGFRDRSAFFAAYGRLSEVLVRPSPRDVAPSVWVNPQAQRPLARKVRSALHRSLSG